MARFTLHLTTDPGLEDLVVAELRAALPSAGGESAADRTPGHVTVFADEDPLPAALRLRSIHRVVRPVAAFPVVDLGQLRAELARLGPGLPGLEDPAATFRVRCKRVGQHPFTSEDVERIAGAGIRDGVLRPVRLVDADVVVRCDVRGATVQVGVEVATGLSRRRPGPFRPETSLRANLAWALSELARPGGPPPGALLDPFAGAGTILVEAAARWPAARLFGSDLHARCVDGVRENLAAAGASARAEVRGGDARRLDELWPDHRFDTIVTNPPFGRRLGRGLDLEALYRSFLRSAAQVATPDARLVVLVEKRGAFHRALRAVGAWETRHVRIVEVGGLYAAVFVLSRPAAG